MIKNIIHINFAKGYRGGERQTQLLIEELSKHGYIQKLLVRKNSELGKRCHAIQNLEVIEVTKPYIFSVCKSKGSTLLHAHETKGAQFAYFANLFYKIPYIITRRVDNPIKNNFFTKSIYKNSFTTIALSKAIQSEIDKLDSSIKTSIIPSAHSALAINKDNVFKLKQRFHNKFLIGNIGELDNTHKGQYYLIEAAKKIATKYPNFHFIFLGKGKDLQNYQEQAQGISTITFEGFVENVGDYISVMNLFVFPSLNEGLGSILFDVMQQKVPIIASNVGGIPDIISSDNGILIPPKNSKAIAQAIEELYLDQKKADLLTTNGFKKVENFSKERMFERYVKLYQKIKQ